MYGLNHIPKFINAIQVDEWVGVYGPGDSVATEYHSYVVPASAAFLYVFLVGRGGNGFTPTVGAAAAGGGGGGCGSITKAILPTILLPKTLYIRISSPSASAHLTSIETYPGYNLGTTIISAGIGRSASSTSGGFAGAAFTAAGTWAGSLALWVSQAGGGAGGAGSTTNGAAVTALATLPLAGGGGGGGSSGGTGGAITGAGIFPTIAGAATGHNPGLPGFGLSQPFGGVGGSGGGGVNGAGTGLSKGGDGAIGCGGGGGGNAASGTPGAGGIGGPGYCMIVAF